MTAVLESYRAYHDDLDSRRSAVTMPSIKDLTIVNSNTAAGEESRARLGAHAVQPRALRLEESDGLQTHDSERQAVRAQGRQGLSPRLRDELAGEGHACSSRTQSHAAEEGAGVLLVPGESARFDAAGGDLDLAAHGRAEAAGGGRGRVARRPGYFFNRKTLRGLSDASGGRVRRFLRGVERAACRTAAGSRRRTRSKRARCTTTKAARRRITCTKARRRIPTARRTAT